MLAGSWALVRSPLASLGRCSKTTRTRAYASADITLTYASRLRHTANSTEETSIPRAIPKEISQQVHTEVFEDASDEYISVAAMSQPPKPSVMDVIDATLPAVLPQSSENSSIFENDSVEYRSVSAAQTSGRRPRVALGDVAAKLVTEQKYDEAYHLIREMMHVGSAIPTNAVYETTACVMLEDFDKSSSPQALSEQVARFETFFSLIPPSSVADRARTFKAIRDRILNTPLINLDLIIRFSLILVRKGYITVVQKYTIPVITRFAPPEVCLQFMDDIIASNKHHSPKSDLDESSAVRASWRLRSSMIRWLAFSDRLDEAMTLLPRNSLPLDGFKLSPSTYRLLRFRLQRSHKPELIPYLDSVLRVPEYFVPNSPSNGEPGTFAALKDSDQAIAVSLPVTSSGSSRTALAASLRRLKNQYVLSASSKHLFTRPPPLAEVVNFFTSYTSSSRDKNGRAIALLRRRVLDLGPGPSSHFLFAEMLYYYHARIPELIIETYVDHFYISAVPREDVLAQYHESLGRRNAECESAKLAADDSLVRSPFRIEMTSSFGTPGLRLWPATGHTSLVWHALVMLARDNASVLQLYHKLLQISTEGFSSFSPLSQLEESAKLYSTALMPPSTWHAKVPAASFTPFLRSLLSTANSTATASLGASLLDDMVRAGIEPNVHHLTEIGQFYAYRGDSRRAFIIMQRLEASEKGKSEAHKPVSGSFPVPDIIFYCALLRAFIYVRNLDDAERVAARMMERYKITPGREGCFPGQNEVINKLWQDLAALREANCLELSASGLHDKA
ncbi:hypothetical protein AX17_002504 [Amanita inopinata Kibby_2008]|nr:hypothetical protein AX17_002504 [Amanita inopinata Kibby_2008]